ncbi:TMAO reductase system sensor histidine kinase/response regulator TorS [Vibrio parahaemolyticus]|nr:TMAO reductase system sensor histidine kinase/response regulator TorS [Vibrio parahaemolyticus]EGR3161207.1 TMAO reductase system sensor histidine kinase/response regulator TorS [Vibrio parahaemolyticus]EJG0319524.1 TMAO reductase system sensor histidine kinase/response regulator TorS [Vibrio parahaemolyticus]EJG0429081.1 TMAO reductase system sensor histidine kinase/response regulator TorS [Vibrio parahaemolyticus]
MLPATASIGRKLLLSFIAMAMLVILSALIGVSGFSLVAKTERNVVDAAIPAMIEARQVSELSTRIISSVQMLSNAQNEQERKEAGRVLFEQLESLLTHIKELGGESFDSKLLDALESNVQNVINNLAELGVTVERKLWLAKEIDTRVEEMRLLSEELEQLTRTQVQNTSTIAVANVTHIYDLLEANKKDQVYQALDALVEVDLDLTERLHELHLLAFKMLNQIEEARTLTNVDRIQQIQTAFENNLKIMKRRVLAVEDPTRSKQMSQLLTELGKRQVVFTILLQQYENNEQSQQLMQKTLELFSELNSTVNKLVDDSNKTTTFAVDQLTNTLKFAQWSLTVISIVGLIVVVLILWRVVYVSVVKRLAEYSAALLSVAQGNLAVELEVKGKDELAHMGQAIITARNTAQALKVVAEGEAKAKRELEEHKEHLEELIEQRTSQLRQANLRLNEEVVNHAQARNEAEQASRAKSAFLATMSHEIRTPMNGVLGTARLLMDSGLNPIQKRYAEIINRSGKTLLAILNDVLDYSKIEAGHLEIRRLGFDLHQMVEDTFQLMNSRAQEKQLLFSYHIESDVSRYWKGDVTRISQVLNNLVGNAIKFTEDGEIDIYVSLNPEDESQVLFEVSDTGIGISKKDQKTLFDAFTQAEGGLNQIGGTGLGLAISKRIVEAMGGVLEVDSEEGEGSRFWFSIPLEESEPVEIGVVASARCKVKAKVLLVEDNEVNRVVAEGFLQSMGHQVVMAEDGLQAERIIDKQDFDIALVDINLPDCDGTDLIQRLKRIERNKPSDKALSPTPMIAVSAHVFAEEVERYLAAGFDGYLPKPVEKEALATLIQDVLDGKQLLLPQSGECLPLSETSDTNLTNENQVEQDHQQREEPEMVIINPSVIQSDMKILGREKMLHIIDLFRNTSADVLGQLVESAEKNDSLAVKNLAHKLKGSAGSLGLTALMNTCQSIEIAAEPLDTYNSQQGLLDDQVAASVNALDELMAE